MTTIVSVSTTPNRPRKMTTYQALLHLAVWLEGFSLSETRYKYTLLNVASIRAMIDLLLLH